MDLILKLSHSKVTKKLIKCSGVYLQFLREEKNKIMNDSIMSILLYCRRLDKTKCILFSREENLPVGKITYDSSRLKQFHIVEYLGCCLGTNLNGCSNEIYDKYICFCLKLNSSQHVWAREFREFNWLPTKERVFILSVHLFLK